jgi:hypothetical protein
VAHRDRVSGGGVGLASLCGIGFLMGSCRIAKKSLSSSVGGRRSGGRALGSSGIRRGRAWSDAADGYPSASVLVAALSAYAER